MAGLPGQLLGDGQHRGLRLGRGCDHRPELRRRGLARALGRVRGNYRGCPGLAVAAARNRGTKSPTKRRLTSGRSGPGLLVLELARPCDKLL